MRMPISRMLSQPQLIVLPVHRADERCLVNGERPAVRQLANPSPSRSRSAEFVEERAGGRRIVGRQSLVSGHVPSTSGGMGCVAVSACPLADDADLVGRLYALQIARRKATFSGM